MGIIIQDEINYAYLSPFKINRDQVIDTIENPDSTKTIHQHDYTLSLFLKKFDSYFIIVDGRPNPSSILVSGAFKFHQHLIRDLPPDNPLAMLEQFANKVGYEMRIGDEKSKFIHAAEIRINVGDSAYDIGRVMNENVEIIIDEKHTEPNKPVSLGDMLLRPKDMGQGVIHVDVALAYSISTLKYERYLKSNNLI